MYNKICKNFKPVFHHFFMESFPDPALWYERRLTYTRSIATSSIGKRERKRGRGRGTGRGERERERERGREKNGSRR